MIIEHPNYPGLYIYQGQPAPAGSFYVPSSGRTLSKIANSAYGVGTLSYALKINKSPWNMANCVYRRKAGKCISSVVPSSGAVHQSSFADGAWLALCQGDTQQWARQLGFGFPVLWIPGENGEEPDQLISRPDVIVGPGDTEPRPFTPNTPQEFPDSPTPGEFDPFTGPEDPGYRPPGADPSVGGDKKSYGWMIGLGALGLAVAGAIYFGREK